MKKILLCVGMLSGLINAMERTEGDQQLYLAQIRKINHKNIERMELESKISDLERLIELNPESASSLTEEKKHIEAELDQVISEVNESTAILQSFKPVRLLSVELNYAYDDII